MKLNSAAVKLERILVSNSVNGTNPQGSETALPGKPLSIKAYMSGAGNTRVSIYANDELIKQSSITVYNSSENVVSMYYKVPATDVEEINICVELDNGEQIVAKVPVEKYDYYVTPSDITWEKRNSGYYVTARIHRDSHISFTTTSNTLKTIFLVDGVAMDPVDIEIPSGSIPYIGTVKSKLIPISDANSMHVTVVTDAARLFAEEDETNNIAEVDIPKVLTASTQVDISVNSIDIGYSPKIVVPGTNVELYANFHNNSSVNLPKSIKVQFLVNDEVMEGTIQSYYLDGEQYYHFYKMWTVPEDQVENPIITFKLDPENTIGETNTSDNTASIAIELAQPDLSIVASGIGENENLPALSNQIQLSAAVTNTGQVAVESAAIEYKLDGSVVGQDTVDVPAFSTVYSTITVEIPKLVDLPVDGSLTGYGGFVNRDIHTRSLLMTATVDKDNEIAESNESNNTSDNVTLYEYRPSSAGTVYVKVMDLFGNPISGATVNLTASGSQASASADSYGYCTFKNVPFGTCKIEVNKKGYQQATESDEQILLSEQLSYTAVNLDNTGLLSGKITLQNGSGLSGVTVSIRDTNIRTTSDSFGNYTLKIPAGDYSVVYTKEGYNRVNEELSVSFGEIVSENLIMTQGNNTYISGTVYDVSGEPYGGMTVEIKNVNNVVLGTAITDVNGKYDMDIPLTSTSMWVSVNVSGNNQSAIQGVYASKGIECNCDISFEPVIDNLLVLTDGEIQARVAPWVECASMPGTVFNPDYKVETIYGMFDLGATVNISNSRISSIDIATQPLFWLYASVSSSWNPLDLLARNEFDKINNYVIGAVLPIDIPIAMNLHSSNSTKVWIKKIAIVSDGNEIASVYPDAVGNYTWSKDVDINLSNSSIKLYLKVDPDDGVVNPVRGYGKDRVLIEWNPNTNSITKMGNYVVTGWDEVYAHETYIDE